MPADSRRLQLSRNTLAWLLLATVAFGGVTLAYPVGGWDIPTYSYVASVIREGGVPYRDAWDLKSPGVFFAHAMGQVLFGTSPVAIRLFDLLWQFATSLLVAQIALSTFRNRNVALLAGLLYLLTYFARNLWDWAQPDSLVALPLAAGVVAALRGKETRHPMAWLVAGMSVGAAALLKPPFGVVGIAFLILAATGTPRRIRAVAASWLALAAGLSIALGACAAYFWARGAWSDLWITQFVLAPEYVARIHSYRSIHCLFRSALQPVNAPIHVMALLAAGTVASLWRGRREERRGMWLAGAWAATALGSMIMHGKYDSMHYVALLAPLAILAAQALCFLWGWWTETRRWPAMAVLVILAATLVVPANKLRQHAFQLVRGTEEAPLHQLGTALRAQAGRQSTVFVWGNTPAVYFYAQRRSPSRFIHAYFLAQSWSGTDLRRIFLQEWREHPPDYFVLVKFPKRGQTLQEAALFKCQPEDLDLFESFWKFDELRVSVEGEYTVTADTEFYVLYQRKQEEGGAAPGAGL